tara:strand:- start:9821 stop:11542 length:1722 start_codon:yes stop_codon:yes gene_type:complete
MAKQNINFNTFVPEDLTKSSIDWGAVATGLTSQLTAIKKEKEARKDKIEDDTYKKNRELRDLEQYDSPSLNQLVISASGSAQNFLKTQNDLFKRGLISETDYTKAMDRISGNFTDFSKAAKNYDASYKAYQDRIAADPSKGFLGSSSIEQDFAEGALAFGNLKGLQEYVNPTTGEISLVRPNEDGSIPKDPSKHMPFSGMNNRMNFRLDKFDVLGRTKTIVDSLGTTISKTGTLDDATIFTETATANKDKYISGFMAKDLDVASVLTDSMGDFYTTTDTNDTDPNAIHINYSDNNQPTIIDDAPNWATQKEKAKEYMGQVFDDQIDNKQKAIRTKFANEDVKNRRNEINDKKFQAVKVGIPDYNQKRLLDGSERNAVTYIDKTLDEEIGAGDSDSQVFDVYTNLTQSYIPKAVNDYYAGKGQGLKTMYLDDSIIKKEVIPEGHPDYDPENPTKEGYYILNVPHTLRDDDSIDESELHDPYEDGDRKYYNNERQAKADPNHMMPTQADDPKEYMIIEFGGRKYKIESIRRQRSVPIWESIKKEIIEPSIQPYNDFKYKEIYGQNPEKVDDMSIY